MWHPRADLIARHAAQDANALPYALPLPLRTLGGETSEVGEAR
jgi:hypothetical protein